MSAFSLLLGQIPLIVEMETAFGDGKPNNKEGEADKCSVSART